MCLGSVQELRQRKSEPKYAINGLWKGLLKGLIQGGGRELGPSKIIEMIIRLI